MTFPFMNSYGLENTLAPPIISLLLSVLLILGTSGVGYLLGRRFIFRSGEAQHWQLYASPIIGSSLISAIFYPLILGGSNGREVLLVAALALASLGIVIIINSLQKIQSCGVSIEDIQRAVRQLSDLKILLVLLLIAYAFLALSPATDADSLGYHLGVPLALLHSGTWPFAPEWFSSRLAGAGEMLNAIGLSIGAEHFGSLLQFCGLLGIVSMLLPQDVNNGAERSNTQYLIALSFLTAPVFLFLVSSSKPQLLPVAMTTLAMMLIIHPSRRLLTRKEAIFGFSLVCLLVMTAAQMKLNFRISGFIVGIVGIVFMTRNGLALQSLVIGTVLGALVMVPEPLWKVAHFGGTFADGLIKPFPGNWPGYPAFETFARQWRDSDMPFPFSFFITLDPGLITTTLGVGIFLGLGLRPEKDIYCWAALVAALLVAVLGGVLGQTISRSYLEPFTWILMALTLQKHYPTFITNGVAASVIRMQSILVGCLVLFGVFTLFPGALATSWREQIMDRSANGYSVMRWADTVLPKEAVLLSDHTSLALSPRATLSTDWMHYLDINGVGSMPYLNRIKTAKVTYMLVRGELSESPFRGCFDKIHYGPFVGHNATRNPFNMNKGDHYNAWIVKFDSEKLPDCARHAGM